MTPQGGALDQAERLRNIARVMNLKELGADAAVLERDEQPPEQTPELAYAPYVQPEPEIDSETEQVSAYAPDLPPTPSLSPYTAPTPAAFAAFSAESAAAISSRVITVTSGKGGVGKTNFTVNLAVALSNAGKRVVILDADFGLANIEVLFGVIPRYNLGHVFSGQLDIQDILTQGPGGIQFLSGGSGLRELANISSEQMSLVIDKLSYLDTISDIILIDTGAGISDSVLNFIRASSETIIITTPEPTSVTDAYAIIKAAKETKGVVPSIKVVINRADNAQEGREVYDKISSVAKRFLDLDLESLGSIPYDNNMVKSVKSQKPMLLLYPQTEASRAVEAIARDILSGEMDNTSFNAVQNSTAAAEPAAQGIKGFMRKLSGLFK